MTVAINIYNIATWDATRLGPIPFRAYGSLRKGRKAWLDSDKSVRSTLGHASTKVSHSVRVGRASYLLGAIMNGRKYYSGAPIPT